MKNLSWNKIKTLYNNIYNQWLVPAYSEIPTEFPMASTCLQLFVPNHATAHTLTVVNNAKKIRNEMNIDELTNKIRKVSSEKNVQTLAELIQQWKTNEKNAIELKENIEWYFENDWIDKKSDFQKVYGMWSDFRDSTIHGIGGMTMNERLYLFGLVDLFDNSKNVLEREKFYKKLLAKNNV